jgi:FlaA1/EpsC-like NDP-sugar epimerase
MSWAVVFIDFNLLCLFLIAARSSFRVLEYLHLSKNQPGKKVLIYGLGRSGVHALNEFINNPRLNLSPVGFIDDDERNRGKHVSGYPVFGTLAALENILSDNPVSEVIVSQDDLSVDKLEYLYQICASHQISLRRLQTSLEEIPLQSNHVVH